MLKIPGTIEKFESRADNTWKLTVGTQELHQSDIAELAVQKGKLGHFVFAASEQISEQDIPTEQLERNEKSPSQRIRAVLYRLWEKEVTDHKKMDFEIFYRTRMERLIEAIKAKLD